MAAKKWTFRSHDQSQVEALVRSAGVSPVVAQLLLNREINDAEEACRFLDAKLTDLHPPDSLPGVSQATDRIMAAIDVGEEIVVYGDYDADGMTATAILYRCLKLLKAKVAYHLPNRMEEGYGLHIESVEKLAARGKQLLITVDCGIASVAAAERARELGLSLVITDHHRYGNTLPVADALVHPSLPGSNYPFSGLCGAGVAFKLAWSLCQRESGSPKVSDEQRVYLLQAVGLAAIGTVADVVPLTDENRAIVRNGLKTLLKTPTIGLSKLMEITKVNQKKTLDSEDIGFMLAPRLNAAGRLGQAQLGVELLVTEDADRAEALASYISELNENRHKLERSIQISANKQLKEVHSPDEDPAFVLASPNWHPGVIGIVAGKLAEKYHRPVVLIALDKLGTKPGTGSARSPNGVNLHAAFEQCGDLLVSGGGHAAAAGCKIDENQLKNFRSAFMEAVAEQASSLDTTAEIQFDAEATLDQLDLNALTQVEKLAPFGMGNPRPMFCALNVTLTEPPKLLGASGRHMSFQFLQFGKQMRAVAFGQAEEWMPKFEGFLGPVDLAFRPVINEFRGFRKVELHLADWRVHGQAGHSAATGAGEQQHSQGVGPHFRPTADNPQPSPQPERPDELSAPEDEHCKVQ